MKSTARIAKIIVPSLALFLCACRVVVAGESLYRGTEVVELTPSTFRSKVLESNAMWMIEFYAPWCGHCQKLKPDYIKAASTSKGAVRFGAINCDDHKSIGGEYGVKGFPTLKIFGTNKKKPQDYNGARSSKAMADFLLAQLPNHIKVLTSKSHPKWLADNLDTPKAVLMSSKTVTSPLYKSLALDLKDRMLLGEVRAGKEKDLMVTYGVREEEVPVLLVLPPGAEAGPDLIRYEGKLKQEPLLEFLEQHAIPDKKKKKTEKPEKEEKKEKEDKKENKEKKGGGKNEAAESTPQPPKSALIHAKPGDDLKVECGGKKGLCVLTFLEGQESPEVPKLEVLAAKYARDPLRVLWADSGEFVEIRNTFSSDSGIVTAIINNKRGKYVAITGLDTLEQTLDRALGGDLEMKGVLGTEWGSTRENS